VKEERSLRVCVLGGLLSVQIQHSSGIHSAGEGAVAHSERLHSDHEDGTGKVMLMRY